MALTLNATTLSIGFDQCSCIHTTINASEPHNAYPNVLCIKATLHHNTSTPIGNIKANLLNKRAMDALSPSKMWQECQAYDTAHTPSAKLNKVENYLANESFPAEHQAQIDEAEWVLYIDEAYIDPSFRGKGFSLLALDLLIKQLVVGEKCVVLLQAGSIMRFEKDGRTRGLDAVEAYEKIARHWRRMGFHEWSDSDDAWLCLWSGARLRIEDVVPELFAPGEM